MKRNVFSFDEKRNLILLLVKEVIYTPAKLRVLFWGDIPEMKFDLKNPPDWTPPPPDDGDTSYTPKGSGGPGVEALMRTRNLVRMGMLNGSHTHEHRQPVTRIMQDVVGLTTTGSGGSGDIMISS